MSVHALSSFLVPFMRSKKEFSDKIYDDFLQQKAAALEYSLGKTQAVYTAPTALPFEMGGLIALACFPQHRAGTGFATLELIAPDGFGAIPNEHGTYELLAFTKTSISTDTSAQEAFEAMQERLSYILTMIGRYAFQAKLKPYNSVEIPEKGSTTNISVILDLYMPRQQGFIFQEQPHHLLLCMEVFPEELAFAKANSVEALLLRLEAAGYYPYSDLNRPSLF